MDEEYTVVLDCSGCGEIQTLQQSPTVYNLARNLGWQIPHHNQPPYVCPKCVKNYLKKIKENV